MLINKLLPIFLSLVLFLSLFVGCRSTDDNLTSDSSQLSDVVYSSDDTTANETVDTESNDSTVSSEEETTSETTSNSSEETSSNNIVSVGDNDVQNNTSSEENLPPTYIEEDENKNNNSSDNTVNEKDGYSGETFSTSPNAQGKLVTVKIAPNSTVFYKIGRVSNKILTINSANAYVIYNGTKYEAKNGVLSFFVASDELASAQIMFEIGNKGSKGESFTVQFTSKLGSSDNPEEIKSIDTKFSTSVNKDNDQGYFYKYKASNTGKIKFYLLSDSTKYKLSVGQSLKEFNNVVAWGISDVIEEATYYRVSKDSTGICVEFDVKNGDEFTIIVSPLSDEGTDSAVTIDWKIVV